MSDQLAQRVQELSSIVQKLINNSKKIIDLDENTGTESGMILAVYSPTLEKTVRITLSEFLNSSDYELLENKDEAGGYASLDSRGKINTLNLPDLITIKGSLFRLSKNPDNDDPENILNLEIGDMISKGYWDSHTFWDSAKYKGGPIEDINSWDIFESNERFFNPKSVSNTKGKIHIPSSFDWATIENYANSILIIEHIKDFENATITLPVNVDLQIQRGQLKNVTLIGDNTKIIAGFEHILENVTIQGTWDVPVAHPEWFGASGDGVANDTNAFTNAKDLVNEFGVIKCNKNRIYSLTTVNIDKSITLDINDSTITSSDDTITDPVFYVGAVGNVEVKNTKANYTGEFYQVAYNGGNTGTARNFIESYADYVRFENMEISGFSSDGIKVIKSKKCWAYKVNSSENGYAGIRILRGKLHAFLCDTDDNGGSNGVDGYGIVANVGNGYFYNDGNGLQDITENSAQIIMCNAHRNMSRGIDSHAGTNVNIDFCHVYETGISSNKWKDFGDWATNQKKAVGIRAVNDITDASITNCTVIVRDNILAAINFIGTAPFNGIENGKLNSNTIKIYNHLLRDDEDSTTAVPDVFGIMVTPYISKTIEICNNIIQYIGDFTSKTGILTTTDWDTNYAYAEADVYFETMNINDNTVNGDIAIRSGGHIKTVIPEVVVDEEVIEPEIIINGVNTVNAFNNNCNRLKINSTDAIHKTLVFTGNNKIKEGFISMFGKNIDVFTTSIDNINSESTVEDYPNVYGIYVVDAEVTVRDLKINSFGNKLFISGSNRVIVDGVDFVGHYEGDPTDIDSGINLENCSNIQLDNINIEKSKTGVRVSNCNNITVLSRNIKDCGSLFFFTGTNTNYKFLTTSTTATIPT